MTSRQAPCCGAKNNKCAPDACCNPQGHSWRLCAVRGDQCVRFGSCILGATGAMCEPDSPLRKPQRRRASLTCLYLPWLSAGALPCARPPCLCAASACSEANASAVHRRAPDRPLSGLGVLVSVALDSSCHSLPHLFREATHLETRSTLQWGAASRSGHGSK
jgi:hypothetical protein